MAKLFAVPPSLQFATHEVLQDRTFIGYSEADIANAFKGILFGPSLQNYTAMQTPSRTYLPIRGQLGLTFMPAIYCQRSYPAFLNLMCNHQAVMVFWRDLKIAVQQDISQGHTIDTPIQDILEGYISQKSPKSS